MKKIIWMLLVMVLAVLGLRIWLHFDSQPFSMPHSKEYEKIMKVVSINISIGDDETKLVGFFKAQSWKCYFNQWKNAYTTTIVIEKKDGLIVHSVDIEVALDSNRRVKAIHGIDEYLGP